jgi:uncharacterized protein YehS (DUF1456 family)
MTKNDVLRRLRYTFDLGDDDMIALFKLAEVEVSRAQVSDWLKKDNDDQFRAIPDERLAAFLNGLIISRRGKKDGPAMPIEKNLNNNMILRKLKIALNLKDHDMLNIMQLANFNLSKHELSAFFRNPKQSQYRECLDQVLRVFLQGLQKQERGDYE